MLVVVKYLDDYEPLTIEEIWGPFATWEDAVRFIRVRNLPTVIYTLHNPKAQFEQEKENA